MVDQLKMADRQAILALHAKGCPGGPGLPTSAVRGREVAAIVAPRQPSAPGDTTRPLPPVGSGTTAAQPRQERCLRQKGFIADCLKPSAFGRHQTLAMGNYGLLKAFFASTASCD